MVSFLRELRVFLKRVAIVIPEMDRRLFLRMLVAQDAQRF
jgi:hypothetical protein